MQDKVTRLRQLMSEAIPRPTPPPAANEDAWRAWQVYESNVGPPAPQTDRDLAIRAIHRIVMRYHWPQVVQQFLDEQRVPALSALCDRAVDELHERLAHLELCIQTGCDDAHAPPAR